MLVEAKHFLIHQAAHGQCRGLLFGLLIGGKVDNVVVVFGADGRMSAVFVPFLYELRARKVKVGAKGFVTLNAYPGRKFAARVVELGRRMGRKNVRTDDPVERNDTKILEVVLAMDTHEGLIVGQRVVTYVRF